MSLVFDIRAEKTKGVGTTVRSVTNILSRFIKHSSRTVLLQLPNLRPSSNVESVVPPIDNILVAWLLLFSSLSRYVKRSAFLVCMYVYVSILIFVFVSVSTFGVGRGSGFLVDGPRYQGYSDSQLDRRPRYRRTLVWVPYVACSEPACEIGDSSPRITGGPPRTFPPGRSTKDDHIADRFMVPIEAPTELTLWHSHQFLGASAPLP